MKDEQNLSREIGSNKSVLNLSLNLSNNEQEKECYSSDSSSNSSFNIYKFLSKNIVLKEEKEENVLNCSSFECYEIKNKTTQDKMRKRSKTDYIPMCLINNAPKIKPKEFNEDLISPLTLCRKTFFQDFSYHKNKYNIFYDFRNDLIDCKSCNDNLCDNDIFSDYTERTTPNADDLNNFSICRKKMKSALDYSKKKYSYECENILDYNSFFQKIEEMECKKNNSHQNKKNNFWQKHIIKQNLKSKEIKNKCKNVDKRIGLNKSKTYNFDEQKTDTQGLFILGVLESAAKDKKKRTTIGIS